MTSPIPSESMPSASSAKPATQTPSASSAAAASTSKSQSPALPPNNVAESIPAFTTVGRESGPALSSKVLGFIVIIKAAKGGTLHAVMNPKAGPGVLAVFEDVEQAVNATTGIPACKTNEFFIIPVGGE